MQWTATVPKWHGLPVEWFQEVVRHGSRDGLFVLPSTSRSLADTRRVLSTSPVLFIGDPTVIPGAITPAAYVARLHTPCSASSGAPFAIAFTDQLVSANDAPILITRNGQLTFMPVLEVLAQCQYKVNVHIWNGEEVARLTAQCAGDVLREVAAYFDACSRLGSAWLMRDRQALRLPAVRIDQARRRLRLYQSAIFNSSADAPLSMSALQIARQISGLRSALHPAATK